MKRFVGLLLLISILAEVTAFAVSVQTIYSDPVVAKENRCILPAIKGKPVSFSAADLEKRAGLASGSLKGLTITRLPNAAQGELLLNGKPVHLFQEVNRKEMEQMIFQPDQNFLGGAEIGFLPLLPDSSPTLLSIQTKADTGHPPVARGDNFITLQNVKLDGYIDAFDPDGDAVTIQVLRQPAKGQITFHGLTFEYSPYLDCSGSDQFTFCAVDGSGNYSDEVTGKIQIDSEKGIPSFTDLSSANAEYAARKLHQSGILCGERVGQNWFFYPDRVMTGAQFLPALLASKGLDGELPVCVNTGLQNDSSIPLWLKPYVKCAQESGILLDAFDPDAPVSRAAAICMTDRASGFAPASRAELPFEDADSLPDWSVDSYETLSAYGVITPVMASALPEEPLTRDYCARLLWQLYSQSEKN